MAKLPDVDFAEPVQTSSQTAALPYEAASGLSKVMSEGLQQYSAALRESQATQAALEVSEGMNQIANTLKAKKYLSTQEVVDTFDGKVPPEIDSQIRQYDPTTGQMVEHNQIPTWAVGDALAKYASKKLVDSAASKISGQGWQTKFKEQIAPHVLAQRQALTEQHLQAMDQYLQESALTSWQRLINAGDFGAARHAAFATALPAQVQVKLADHTETARQEYAANTALLGSDPVKMRAEANRLQTDETAMKAIPQEKRDRMVVELQNRARLFEGDAIAQRLVAEKGAQNADGTMNLGQVQARLDSDPAMAQDPALKQHVIEAARMRERISVEQRDAMTGNAAAAAIHAFTALGPGGQPFNSIAQVMRAAPQAWEVLNSPEAGQKGADIVHTLEAWERAEKDRQRDQLMKPSPAQAANAVKEEAWIYENKALVRSTQVEALAAKWLYAPEGGEAYLSQADYQRLGNLVATIKGQTPDQYFVASPKEVVINALREAIPHLKQPEAKWTAQEIQVVNEVQKRANERFGDKPNPVELQKFIQDQVAKVKVKGWLYDSTSTRVQAELQNKEIVPEETAAPTPQPKPTPKPQPSKSGAKSMPAAGMAWVKDKSGRYRVLPASNPLVRTAPPGSVIMGPAEEKP